MEGASKRIIPSFFQKQNPADEAEAAIPSKRTPKETRLARSQTPAFREPRKRRADSPADGLSEFIERHRSAKIDNVEDTQRQLDSGGKRSNTRNAIFTFTQNSTQETTPDDSNAGNLSNDTSDDTSDTGSQLNVRIHRRARNRDQREKQLRTERSDRNQDNDDDEELADTETEANTNPGTSLPNSPVTLPTYPDATDKRMAELREVERLADLREVEKSTARREAARREAEQSTALRDVQARWNAGEYAVTTTAENTLPTNPSSDTIRESLDESSYSANKPSSIQFQRIPSEAMKKLSNTSELAFLRPLLETQPDALHQTIIDASTLMLALSKAIFERETRYRKFGQPIQVIDPATGIARTRTDGTPITTTFMPQSLRKMNNPAFATSDISEDPRVTTLKDATADLLQKYKTDMSEKMKEMARLEVTFRKERLSEEFLKRCRYFADTSIISRRASDAGLDDPERDRQILKHEVVLNMLGKLEPDHIKELYLTSNECAVKRYKEIHDDAIEQGPDWTEDIEALVESLSTHLLQMLTTMSVNLFKRARARATIRARQSELLEFIAKERDNAATDDLAEALENSRTIEEGNLNDYVSKIARKHLHIQSKAAKKLQKKSLGGDKSQTSEPTDNGQKTPNDSSKRRGEQLPKQPKSKKQKPGKDGAHPPDRPGETKNGETVPQNEPRQNQQITNQKKKKKKKNVAKANFQEEDSEVKKSTTYRIQPAKTNEHSYQRNERNPCRSGRGRGGRGASQARGRGGRGRER